MRNCPGCGEPFGGKTICRDCKQWRRAVKGVQVERLWAENYSVEEIAKRLGTTKHAARQFLYELRQDGYDLPTRRVRI